MPTIVERSASWLGRRLQAQSGRSVTIVQGATEISGVTAVAAEQQYEVVDSEGFATSAMVTDWMFVAADLPSEFQFRAGAQITEVNGEAYEVLPIGTRPAVERADSFGVLLRVHTKRVA